MVLMAGALSVAMCGLASAQNRVSTSQKGSLLFYSKVDLRWNAAHQLTQDTILSLLNDYPDDVYVQMYFVNGDEPLDPVMAGDPPMLIAEGEPGWNWVDCALNLTMDQPTYWSAATGLPAGCQPFTILDGDNGNGPGRPNPEANDGSRVLRGFVIAWAVNSQGQQIRWNHLSGKATIINYEEQAAWEYSPWAFQARTGVQGDVMGDAGRIDFDGTHYDYAFDLLLLDFFASGSQALSRGTSTVTVDTDLTLHPVTVDLRQETHGPKTTKANFDIWNMAERKFSGTHRCITCWDQALVSNYDAPRTFLVENLQSDKGKARIDGLGSQVCDINCIRGTDGFPVQEVLDILELPYRCSYDAALLGVAAKVLQFSGTDGRRAMAGSNLVGMGEESGSEKIKYDVTTPPSELREDSHARLGSRVTKDAQSARPSNRIDNSSDTKRPE
jgi:hypothetical protein